MKKTIFILFLFPIFVLKTQEIQKSFDFGLRYSRTDFFLEGKFERKYKKLAHGFGLGFGMNRSFFQQRINPELFYSISSNFKQFEKFEIQIVSAFHSNFYNVNKKNREIHFFNEILIGPHVGFGKNKSIYFEPLIGFISESFRSDFSQKVNSHWNYSYSAKISYRYVF